MRTLLALAAALALGACEAAAASAQTFPAGCVDGLGDPGALALAIDKANSAPGPDTVELGAGCAYLLRTKQSNWYGADALPPIASDITIQGNGATIARDPTAAPLRLFFVGGDPGNPSTTGYVSPGAGTLTLRDVTLANGYVRGGDSNVGGGGAGMGGAIFNQGVLVIERSTLVRNGAQGGASGNIQVGSGGGGIGSDSVVANGGGFGQGPFGEGGKGGSRGVVAGGGGAGFPRRRGRYGR